jgi:hypothetical protein
MWLIVRPGKPRGMVEGPANPPADVAVLPENVPQEHQFRMKAALITHPVHQCGKYGTLVGRIVMRAEV